MIVTNYKTEDGLYNKEVLLYSDEQILSEEISKYQELRDVLDTDKNYQLKNMKSHFSENESQNLLTWKVGNLKMTRKNLEKLIKEFYIFKIYSDFL